MNTARRLPFMSGFGYLPVVSRYRLHLLCRAQANFYEPSLTRTVGASANERPEQLAAGVVPAQLQLGRGYARRFSDLAMQRESALQRSPCQLAMALL